MLATHSPFLKNFSLFFSLKYPTLQVWCQQSNKKSVEQPTKLHTNPQPPPQASLPPPAHHPTNTPMSSLTTSETTMLDGSPYSKAFNTILLELPKAGGHGIHPGTVKYVARPVPAVCCVLCGVWSIFIYFYLSLC